MRQGYIFVFTLGLVYIYIYISSSGQTKTARNFPEALDLATYKRVKKDTRKFFQKNKTQPVYGDLVCIYVVWMFQ